MTDSVNRFPDEKTKVVTLSYDDGTVSDRKLVEILNKYGLKGTFHLNSGRMHLDTMVRPEEVAGLYAGHEVAGHTVSHPHLDRLDDAGIRREIGDDRRALEDLVGYPVTGFSYPYGEYSDRIVAVLREEGLEYGRTVHADAGFGLPDDPLRWRATCHHRMDLMAKARDFVAAQPDQPMLMYVWGHSYEFDRRQNWDLMEDFCKLMSENADTIRFATNLQVVHSLRSRWICKGESPARRAYI